MLEEVLYVVSPKRLEHCSALPSKVAVGLPLEGKQKERHLSAKIHGIQAYFSLYRTKSTPRD